MFAFRAQGLSDVIVDADLSVEDGTPQVWWKTPVRDFYDHPWPSLVEINEGSTQISYISICAPQSIYTAGMGEISRGG